MSVMFDFDSVKKRLQDRLKAKTSWANILFFSTNQRIIDIVAEEIAYSMQYDEMLTRESKWNIAQQITSIMSENQFFNYVVYNRAYYANDYKSIKSDIQKYINENPDGINHINIKVFNREIKKDDSLYIELSGEGNIDINKKMFTIREYSGICNIIVNEDEFYSKIIEWVENQIKNT